MEAEQVKFVLRLPASIHKKVKRSAKGNNTSMNKEITNIVRDSYKAPPIQVQLDRIEALLRKKK